MSTFKELIEQSKQMVNELYESPEGKQLTKSIEEYYYLVLINKVAKAIIQAKGGKDEPVN